MYKKPTWKVILIGGSYLLWILCVVVGFLLQILRDAFPTIHHFLPYIIIACSLMLLVDILIPRKSVD